MKKLFMIAGFASCNKESKVDDLSKFSNSTSQNPFNFVGMYHNNVLREIANLDNFDSISYEEIYNYIKYYCNNVYNSNINLTFQQVEDELELSQKTIDSFNVWTDKFEDLGYYDQFTKQVVLSIYNLVTDSSLNLLDTNLVYSEIAKIEKDIITFYGMPQNLNIDNRFLDFEKAEDKATYLLIGCAIAKYSFAFWAESYYTTTPWSPELETAGFWKSIGNWFARVGADIGGFFSNPTIGPAGGMGGIKFSWSISEGIANGKAASAKKKMEQVSGPEE